MSARELLADLAGAGFSITARGDGVVIRPASKLTDPLRTAVRAAKPELLALLAPTEDPAALVAQPAAGIAGHTGSAWGADEIDRYTERHARLRARGFADEAADAVSEQLTMRDRDGDDRRICAECAALDRRGRCQMAAMGRLQGASRQFEPALTILRRCEGFTLAKDLS